MNDNALETFDDVADSTDWLSTPLSGLAAVEAALRCQVCKDFYKTPMLTSCNHTFCSICIRRALSNDGKCPLCRTTEQEMKLRSNWSMEEVVAAFTKARPDVLLFAKTSQEAAAEPAKRKLEETEDFESGSEPSGKRLRSSARLSKSRSMEATSEMARLEADIPDQDQTNFEPDDGLVACPICWQRMKEVQVNKHLDTSCPGEPQPQKTPSRHPSRSTSISIAFSSPPPKRQQPRNMERLPAINYSILREPQLKKKLSELGISTAGNRQMLERRHKEWMTIWNANCDSQYPRQKRELLQDLDVWERTVGARAPMSSRSNHLGAQIRDKDFDGAAWASKHDNSFKDLIANARRNKAFAEQKAGKDETSTGEIQQTTNAGNGAEEIGGEDPVPQPNAEMPTSLPYWGGQQTPVDPTLANGVIDLTGETAPPDGDNGTVDLDTSSKSTLIS